MAGHEDLRAAARDAQAEVDELRERYRADTSDDEVGQALYAAREAASAAWAALWDAVPEEKPPPQQVL